MKEVERCLLLDLLKSRKMTQTELANRIGGSKQQIGSYIRNSRMMSLTTAYNIAEVLGCEIKDLYTWRSKQ